MAGTINGPNQIEVLLKLELGPKDSAGTLFTIYTRILCQNLVMDTGNPRVVSHIPGPLPATNPYPHPWVRVPVVLARVRTHTLVYRYGYKGLISLFKISPFTTSD
jgi:hypothetical protein